jgi:hypothetical protein
MSMPESTPTMGIPMPESTLTLYARVDFFPPSQGLRIWPLDIIHDIFTRIDLCMSWVHDIYLAGTPLKPEYTEENLPLVEAGFCNLRKQVIISKIIEECAGKVVFVLRGLRGWLAYVEVGYTLALPPLPVWQIRDVYPGSEFFFHRGSNNKKRRRKNKLR